MLEIKVHKGSNKVLNFLLVVVIAYSITLGFLYFFQNKLVFFSRTITQEYSNRLIEKFQNVEEIRIKTEDNTYLHGWLVRNSNLEKSPLIIYYGGNGEEVSHMVLDIDNLKNYSLLIMNYRGYGLSEGVPGEENLIKDAELIFDTFSGRKDIDNTRIVLMGRSIGTGVAVQIAAKKDVQGVILITPYDSLVRIAQNRFRIFPVSLIMKTRFDSISKASKIDAPMLALIAERDEVIPAVHAFSLEEQWGGASKAVVFDGVGHNTIQNHEGFWKSIGEFLDKLN